MKNKKKKIVLATIIIILGIISYFFIDSYLFNKKEKKPKNYAYITYIVTDYDKTKNSDFNNILTYAHFQKLQLKMGIIMKLQLLG